MSLSSEDLSYIAQLQNILGKLQLVTVLGIFPIGFLLNGCITLVFMRKKFQSNSMGLCNIIVSLTNNIILLLNFGFYYTDHHGNNIIFMSNFACVFFYYATKVFSSFHSWLIVMFSFSRLTFLAFPFRFKFMRKKIFVCITSLVLLAINTIIYWPNFYYSQRTSEVINLLAPTKSVPTN